MPNVIWRLLSVGAAGVLLAAALLLSSTGSHAQVCPTAPPGTSNNQCASTAFVQAATATSSLTVGTSQILNGTSGRVLYQNGSVLGELPTTGTGNVVLSASPTLSGTIGGSNILPLTGLAQSGANTLLGNWTGSTANVLANAMPSCPDSGGNHLNYVSGTGITCGTGLGNGITSLTGDVTATGPGAAAATLTTAQPGAHTWALGQTFSSAMTYGGVTLSNSVTGTGSMVLDTSPSVSGLTVTGSFTATGLVTNADLANPATTVNGQTCTLGSTCTVTAAATSITVGTTTIGSGTDTRIIRNNAGVVGEYTITGTGTVVAMQNGPSLTAPNIGDATGTSIALTGTATIYNATAIPAGGTIGTGYKFSSTSNFGVFFGSGVPSLSAAQGSLYLRSDGSPLYNTDGATNWATFGGGTNTAYVDDFLSGTDFTGGTTTSLILSHTPSSQQIVTIYFDGVAQAQNTWSLATATVTFNQAIPVQVQVVEAQYYTASSTAGVVSLNGLTGTLSIAAGAGMTVTPAGSTITLAAGQTITSKTANYTIANTDCGTTIQAGTGSTGLFTITLPAVSGFTAGCTLTVINGDTARGKKLSGFPTGTNPILWPRQTISVTLNAAAGAWITNYNPGPWYLPSSQEICVRQDGDNTSDGLGNGSVAADCMATIQNAVLTIGQQWNGGGYTNCKIGLYAGGTSTFTSVSQTGQSIGCYLTFNIYDDVSWGSTTACLSTGDGAIAIINISSGKTLTLNCNTSNAASSGAIYGHQDVILDINGPGTYKWIPGGSNDNFLFLDAQGRATLNAPFTLGDGTSRSGNSFITCDAHCAGVGVSGQITTSASMTLSRMYALYGGSWMNLGATYVTTGTVTNASLSSGNSTLITNGTSVPTGTTTAGTGAVGVVCATKC